MTLTRWTAAVVVIGLSIAGTADEAVAQPAAAQAEALFDKGKKLMADGKTAEACEAFESSQKLDPLVTTLMNLAACREKNNQLASAWARFLEAERMTRGKQGGEKKLNQTASDRAKKLESRLSKLTIDVKQPVTGLEVLRDGNPVDRGGWNTALPVDGGSFSIIARAPGFKEFSTTVKVGNEKDDKTVEIPVLEKGAGGGEAKTGGGTPTGGDAGGGATSGAGGSPDGGDDGGDDDGSQADVEPANGSKALPIALAVAGGVLAGGAIGFELWGRSKYDDSKVEPDDQKQEDLWKAANTRRYVAVGMGAAAVVSVGVSVFLFVRSPKQERQVEARRRIDVTPVASTSLTGLLVHGTF